MKAKDLFTIILKIFGIYLIKDVIISVPPVLYNFYSILQLDADVAVFSLFIAILTLAFYCWLVYLLIFKTNWVISKLQLTSNVSDEPLLVNLHRSSIYTIAIIVSGIVILVFAIPQFVREFYVWYEFIDSREGKYGDVYFDFSPLLKSIAEVIIGLLFLGNQRTIVNFIEARRRESTQD